MRKFLAILQSFAFFAAQVFAGFSLSLLIPSQAFAATTVCNLTGVGAYGASVAGQNGDIWYAPCTTGANAAGYSVTTAQIYIGTTAAGTVYGGIYSDSAGAPHSKLCADTTGISPSSAQYNNTNSLTGCGTLAASTQYWVGIEQSSASNDIAVTFYCSDGYNQNPSYYQGATPGTFPTTAAGTLSSSCYMANIQGNAVAASSHPTPGIVR